MSKGINLLGADKQVAAKGGSKKIKLLRTIAVFVLFGVSGLSVVLFFLIALSPLPSLQKQEQEALTALSQYHPDMAKLLLIDERIRSTKTLLAKRSTFNETLNKLKERVPVGAEITGMTMNSDEIAVTVSSSSLAPLDTFINTLVADTEAKKDFSKVTLKKFITNQGDNPYSLTIVVNLL